DARAAPPAARACRAARRSPPGVDAPSPAASAEANRSASGPSTDAADSPACHAVSCVLISTDLLGRKGWGLRMTPTGAVAWGLQHQLDPFENRGDALAAADAHRDQRVPAAGPAQLVEGLDDQDGAGGAERVTEGDATSVRVGPFRWKAELGGDGEGLRGERLVHLEHVDVIHLQVGS